MVWAAIGKIVAGPLLGFALKQAGEAGASWYDDARVTQAIQLLFHQVIVEEDGSIPETRQQFTAADLVFTITLLYLEGLATDAVFFIEVINNRLSGVDAGRTRYFSYNGTRNEFWAEKPLENRYLLLPRGSRIVGSDRQADQPRKIPDKEWFVQPAHPRQVAVRVLPVPSFLLNPGLDRAIIVLMIRKALERIKHTLREAGHLDTRGQLAPKPRFVSAELQIWSTPLRSASSERQLLHYLLVRNTKLPEDDPVRTMACLYSNATAQILPLH